MIYEAAYDVKWEMEQMKSAIDYFRNTLNRGTDSWEEECEVEMSILNLESQLERLQDLCGQRTASHCSPIGRDNGLKIRPVWVRVQPVTFF